MRRRRLRRWARPSRTRLNPYTLMINSSRVLSLQNGDYGVQDQSICEATDRSSTRLSKRTIYGFLHKSIRNAGNVRILSRFRNHPLRLNRTNAGATDVVVVPYRYKGTLEVAYVTGVSTLLGGGQNHALSVAIVSGSSSVKIRRFRQLKRRIAHELRYVQKHSLILLTRIYQTQQLPQPGVFSVNLLRCISTGICHVESTSLLDTDEASRCSILLEHD